MHQWKNLHWGWLRMLPLGLALALVLVAFAHQVGTDVEAHQRAAAAQQLSAAAPSSTPRTSPVTPQASPTLAAVPSAAPPSPTTPLSPTTPPFPTTALPPTQFAWPAAGLAVDVVPMDWTPGQTVDPPLDPNNFDPVAHWLKGTGQSAGLRPIVLAAHACHQAVPLCNSSTFPFNRLSYEGWAAGQPASLTDARGHVISCALEDRRLTDKSKAFSFPNDPCTVVVFSCNFENPDGEIVLLTFRCGQCT